MLFRSHGTVTRRLRPARLTGRAGDVRERLGTLYSNVAADVAATAVDGGSPVVRSADCTTSPGRRGPRVYLAAGHRAAAVLDAALAGWRQGGRSGAG